MFRHFDIVSVPDGRNGLVSRVSAHKGTVTVQFGAGGPFEKFLATELCFAQDEFLESCDGVDFYKIEHGRLHDQNVGS